MNPIEKLVSYIEEGINHAPSDRFTIHSFEDCPVLLDSVNRIRIRIHVKCIIVTKFDEAGALYSEIIVPWESLTVKQRQRLVELVDTPDDLDPEVSESLTEILKGVE